MTARSTKRTRSLLLAAAMMLLVVFSIHRSYALGHDKTMYDPIYRWRESLAVALSRMRDKPLHGYVAYRSVRDHLAKNGLGLMEGEASPLPTFEERERLILDGARLDRLIQEASRVPIDYSQEPVRIAGNEKGLADFFFLAFMLFGLRLNSLVVFYYCLLALSVVLFLIAFRHSPFCLFVLLAYLVGHYHMIGYASEAVQPGNAIRAVHNSRFLPVLSLLPALHLFLLIAARVRFGWMQALLAAAQTGLLSFLIFCRVQSLWQAAAVLALGAFSIVGAGIGKRQGGWRSRLSAARVAAAGRAWPAAVVLAGLVATAGYSHAALAATYRSETKMHVLWHPLYAGMISASPELSKRYLYGDDPYGDNLAYQAVLVYLRRHNEVPPTFGYVSDGQIYIYPMRDMGAYDQYVKRVFFRTVARYPWLALKSFLYDKPREQIRMLRPLHVFEPSVYAAAYVLALGAAFLSLLAGVPDFRREQALAAVRASAVAVVASSATTLVVPSTLIVDTILLFIVLFLLLSAYLPALGVVQLGLRLAAGEPGIPARQGFSDEDEP